MILELLLCKDYTNFIPKARYFYPKEKYINIFSYKVPIYWQKAFVLKKTSTSVMKKIESQIEASWTRLYYIFCQMFLPYLMMMFWKFCSAILLTVYYFPTLKNHQIIHDKKIWYLYLVLFFRIRPLKLFSFMNHFHHEKYFRGNGEYPQEDSYEKAEQKSRW